MYMGYRLERQKEIDLLGRTRGGWANNINIDLIEIRWGGMDWIDLAYNRNQAP
jgi:hypothetical protein